MKGVYGSAKLKPRDVG